MRRVTRALWVLTVLSVTYGSWYPLQFARPASLHAAWSHMLFDAGWWEGTGDVLANVMLFVPLGALTWRLLGHTGMRRWRRLALVLAGGFAFGFALQVGQLWLPRRWPQLSDAVWNTLGLLLGIGAAPALRGPLRRVAGIGRSPHRAGLLATALWLALAWWPLVPVLNRGQLRWAWHELQRGVELSAGSIVVPALSVAAVLHLLRDVPWRGAAAVALPVLGMLGPFVFSKHPSPAAPLAGWLLGTLLGALSWQLAPRRGDQLLAAAASAALLAAGLLPWAWSATAAGWSWIPLHDTLAEQRVARTLALGWQLFGCALVMIATRRLGLRPAVSASALVLALLALELAQRWMPAQRAEVTPLLLPLLCLLVLRVVAPGAGAR